MDRHALTRRNLVGVGIGGAALAAAPGVLAQASPPSADPARPGTLTTAPISQAGLGPRLTLHAIDNFHGTPGAGMICDLAIREGDTYRPIKTVTTAANGRTPEPLLSEETLKVGRYELLLHVEEYFAKTRASLPSPNFLGVVPVRFVIRDASQRYHLPVLFTPWGYSYYRGS